MSVAQVTQCLLVSLPRNTFQHQMFVRRRRHVWPLTLREVLGKPWSFPIAVAMGGVLYGFWRVARGVPTSENNGDKVVLTRMALHETSTAATTESAKLEPGKFEIIFCPLKFPPSLGASHVITIFPFI